MSTALVSTPAVATDPRLTAFIHPDGPEVFHSVAAPFDLWKPDPFDVPAIHVKPRAEFERLLHRGASLPPAGAVLVIQGESGSGKTHLMRAFRTLAHADELGYCGYMQMTTEASSYARYILTNLLDGLEQPYSSADQQTGLARLSAGLLALVPKLTPAEREGFCNGGEEVVGRVDEYADRLHASERFAGCDVELMRLMLHLERQVPEVRSRALMWLRCQDMLTKDRAWIGGAVPRTDDADPMRMVKALAHLIDSIDGKPLVLLIDQLEDMDTQSAPVERFRKVVDAVCGLADQVPNVVAVLACLEEYIRKYEGQLTKAKVDRLLRDPEPLTLRGNRTGDEVRSMVATRLAHLYAWAGTTPNPADPLFPFRESHLTPLQGLRSRDVLDQLRRHHQRCITAGGWVEPETVATVRGKAALVDPVEIKPSELDPLWNDFHTQFKAEVPDEEPELAAVLATALRQLEPELPDGHHYGTDASDRYVQVEGHAPNNAIDKLLVAVCLKSAKGGGLAAELRQVAKRAGEIPVAIVRTTDFPKSGQTLADLNELLGTSGRRVQVENTDWRRMLAFDAFRKQHATRPDFDMWQKQAKPLTGLASLQKILKLGQLASPVVVPSAPAEPAPVPPPSLVPPPPVAPTATIVSTPSPVPDWVEAMVKKAADYLRMKGQPVQPAGALIGPTFVRLKVELRPTADIGRVRREAENLKVHLGLEQVPIILAQAGHVSIDVPRPDRQTVSLSPLLANAPPNLVGEPAFPVGVGVAGNAEWLNLSEPEGCHLLVAGTTGSGKSEFLKAVLAALAARLTPEHVRFRLIDPKRVTFNLPATTPYLLGPVVYDGNAALPALEECEAEMERRYAVMQQRGVDHIRHLSGADAVPRWVVVMDEFADLMTDRSTKRELEPLLQRLGAKARAAGIHLILGTQRPEASVVTPLLRSNLPGRIGLTVASERDSKLFLDEPDAAYLFLKGDLVWRRGGRLIRLQSPFVSKADFDHLLRVV